MSQKQSLELATLPGEIIGEICKQFYFHCQLGSSEAEVSVFHPSVQDERLAETEKSEYKVSNRYLEGRAALTNLSQSCRLLRDVAEPVLYHTLVVALGHDNGSKTLSHLLRHVLALGARPDLAQNVFELYIRYPHLTYDEALPGQDLTTTGVLVCGLLQLLPNLGRLHVSHAVRTHLGLSEFLLVDKRVLPFLLPAHFANEDKRTPDAITRRLQHLTLGRVQSTQPRINWSFPATLSLDKNVPPS